MKYLRCLAILSLILLVGCSDLSGIDYLQGEKQSEAGRSVSELEARMLVLERSQLDLEVMLGRQAESSMAAQEIADLEVRRSVLEAKGVDVDAQIAAIEAKVDVLFESESYERMLAVGHTINQAAIERVQQGANPFSAGFWDDVLEARQ